MKTIPLNKGYMALVDDDDYERVSAFKWTAIVIKDKSRSRVYGMRSTKWNPETRRNGQYIYLHRFIMEAPSGIMVDHKDSDGLNCQRYNMRLATNSQNNANGRRPAGRAGYRGVTFSYGKPVAQIRFQGKHINLGVFLSPEDAARAYDVAALQRFGEFARLNFPHEHGHAAPTAGANDQMKD